MGAQTEAIPYEEITAQLSRDDRIAVITCNTCVRVCDTGGEEIMPEFARRLRADGFRVCDEAVVTVACHADYIRDAMAASDATAAVVMACEVGWIAVAQHMGDRKVVRACTTSGLLSSVPKRKATASS